MKKVKQEFYIFLTCCLFFACNESQVAITVNQTSKLVAMKNQETPKFNKIPSSNSDTLFIMEPTAVFYQPDAIQFEKIKGSMAPAAFQSQTHEFHFQARNAKIVIKRDWPNLKIKEHQQCRFIKFTKKEGDTQVVDLNKFIDFSGIVLFGDKKTPRQIDMMNIETELYYYYKY